MRRSSTARWMLMLSQFGSSAKTSPQLTKSALGMVDGANDDASVSDISVGSVKSDTSGSSQESPQKSSSPELSRSVSPIPRTGSNFGSRASTPVSFGYPYHQPSQNAMFSESPVLAAIHG
jgi:hypothetical protein